MRLSHNMASLNIYKSYSSALDRKNNDLQKISSGYKVNSAKDDPNAIAKSEKMRIQIRGLSMASRNAQDGASMLQTAEGGLDGITQMLQRIRELTVQSGGTATNDDKKNIQMEINQMKAGIDAFANNTDFNGVKLLNSSGQPLKMPVGANVGENVEIPMFDLTSSGSGSILKNSTNTLQSIDLTNGSSLDVALSIIDSSINQVLRVRSKYGALENRFCDSMKDLDEISDRIQGADSSIRDSDLAEEMMNYSKEDILVNAGIAMMAQSNKFPQDVLKILENVK